MRPCRLYQPSPTTAYSCAGPSPQIVDHHLPGGDPDAGVEIGGSDVEPADSVDQAQPGADGALPS
jgi:hypothetical protein